MLEKEIPLSGGNITGVVRIGQTVRRPMGPWSAAVHGLLQYLETQGFEGAPRFLGVDQQGREILSFIEGEIGTYPLQILVNTKSFATTMLHHTIWCTERENLKHSSIGTRQGLDRGFGILLTRSIASFRSPMHKICRSLG